MTGSSLRATLASGSNGIEGDPCVLALGGGAGIGDLAIPADLDVVVTLDRDEARERAPGRHFHLGSGRIPLAYISNTSAGGVFPYTTVVPIGPDAP